MGQFNIRDTALIAGAKRHAALPGTAAVDAPREAGAAKRAEKIPARAAAFRERRAGGIMHDAELDALPYDPETGLPR